MGCRALGVQRFEGFGLSASLLRGLSNGVYVCMYVWMQVGR